jgi:hypothetical protein
LDDYIRGTSVLGTPANALIIPPVVKAGTEKFCGLEKQEQSPLNRVFGPHFIVELWALSDVLMPIRPPSTDAFSISSRHV